MTALNLTNELLATQNKLKAEQQDNKEKIALLQSTIEQAIISTSRKQA
jgi:cell division protein ZapA